MYNLLIVDDEPWIRRGIQTLMNLEEIGISELWEAETGKEALEMVRRHLPDIVFMDINMPEMDGLTAAATMKETYPKIIVIIITGYDYFEYAQTAIRAKVDDYILKPVSKADLETVLRRTIQILRERTKQEEARKILEESSKEEMPETNDDISALVEGYLREHLYSKDLSLAGMANDIGFNSSYLSVVVKQLYGLPFQDYVQKKRMEKAKLLLLSTSMKNYEIAEHIGMEDVNYFVTKFKKAWGVTPKQYRQGMKSNENESLLIKD